MSSAVVVDDDPMLNDVWTVYHHGSSDPSWTLESYKRVGDVSSAADWLAMSAALDPYLAGSMIFVMREGVFPCWDDPANLRGGCASIKVYAGGTVRGVWEEIARRALDDTLLMNEEDALTVNGVSIAPKRGCTIIKIWMRDSRDWTSADFRLPSFAGGIMFKSNLDSMQQGVAAASVAPPPAARHG